MKQKPSGKYIITNREITQGQKKYRRKKDSTDTLG
jgi:hypothetical protein